MAPRTSWKGHLRLSLVSVPVRAFTANDTSSDVRLNQLHEECNARVKYKKVCPEHGELQSSEIVSGYEYTKDQYVIVRPDELARLRRQPDKSVQIEGFFRQEELDPRYHAGKTYYLLPDGVAGEKPYALLHEGMVAGGVHAIARAVISGREQLVMVRPMGRMLALSVLQWGAAVKDPDEFESELGDQELTADEKGLTQTLISASLLDEFDPASYTDGYAQQLKELIRLKVEGKEIVEAPQADEPAILNLMDALKRSVAAAQANASAPAGAATAQAPSKRGPSKKAPSKKAASKKAPSKEVADKATAKKAASKKAAKKVAPSAGTKPARKKKSG